MFDADVPLEEQGGEVSIEALEAERYHPEVQIRPVFGPRSTSTRSMFMASIPETGFAARPLDNVGVQYGLAALNASEISTTQFLDLNEAVGGLGVDGYHVPERHAASPHARTRRRRDRPHLEWRGWSGHDPGDRLSKLHG